MTWKAWLGLAALSAFFCFRLGVSSRIKHHGPVNNHEWGTFPRKDDPFHFLPCTNATFPPSLDEAKPLEAWQRLSEPDPSKWLRGENEKDALFLCGWLDVPLDYTNASDERVMRISVARFQHHPKPSARTLIIQPGGPGGSGTWWVRAEGEKLSQDYTNSTFDVLGWDMRGTPSSQPAISCFPYSPVRDRWKMLTSLGYHEGDPRMSMLKADAFYEATFRECQRKYGDIPTMLTTPFIARDLEELRKALDEDELSGFFISYGSEIGQTYVNMFPNVVGRLILDGVQYQRNSRELAGYFTYSLDNVTAAYEDGFIGECIDAGPMKCALAKPLRDGLRAPTKEDLIATMDSLVKRAVERPIPGYTEESGPFIITGSILSAGLGDALNDPSSWSQVAEAFYSLLQGNATPMSTLVDDSWEYSPGSSNGDFPDHANFEMAMMIFCSDQYDSPLPPTFDVARNGEQWYLDLWKDMLDQTEIRGDWAFYATLPCRQYNATFGPPKELYRGDLNHTLSNPILLVSPTYDPGTPLRSGKRLLAEMGDNAKLVVHHGYGHTSLGDPSRCTDRWKREYFLRGALPENKETHCYADQKPYRYKD